VLRSRRHNPICGETIDRPRQDERAENELRTCAPTC
jgi:hypothetical protein